jgi:alcohol dehydrogenase class IV
MVGQQRPLWDFEDVADWWTRVNEGGMAPVVAVPTTSGTGSEVGRVAVIVDEQARKKKLIFHPKLVPGRVLCDPELTVGMPAGLTGAVGLDALSHNLEAYCSPLFHPMADGIALEGMRLVAEHLGTAVRDGTDIAARSAMMAASTMGATAFQKGLGAMHAIAHPVGARFDTHHGTTIAVVMPYVLWHNRDALGQRLARLAGYLALPGASLEAVMRWVLELRRALGIPHTLGELGVTAAAVAELAAEAEADPSAATNPVPLDRSTLEALIADAIEGGSLPEGSC